MRGGRVVFQNIQKPNTDEWVTALNAVEASLELEKSVHQSLLDLHKSADEHEDAQLTDFIEGEYLKEQVSNSLGYSGYMTLLLKYSHSKIQQN